MPVISVDYRDLEDLLGFKIARDELIDRIPMIGADIERSDDETVDIEFFPDRPDLYSVEGVARALRAFTGHDTGLKTYPTTDSGVEMIVDPSVNEVRPFVVAGVVKNVVMTDELIASLMDLQEKIHLTLGRKRVKVSIGVHDFDTVVPPFTYKAIDPEAIQFVPLGHTEYMDLSDILRKHEKGIAYANILEDATRYPIIVDQNEDVLSFPPIINGTLTQIVEETTNTFLDVTGLDLNAISCALNIVATALAERGGEIQTVTLRYPDRTIITPDLTPRSMDLDIAYTNRILGMTLSASEITKALERMGFATTIEAQTIKTGIPCYRYDILHPIDLVEDVAIGHGFERFDEELPHTMTFGHPLPHEMSIAKLRALMIGLGYLEIMTLTLSNDFEQFGALGLPVQPKITRVLNPITESYTNLRESLLPSLFKILHANKHRDLPQRIFEIGEVVVAKKNETRLAAVSIHSKASFTEIKSIVEALVEGIGAADATEIKTTDHPLFIHGRGAHLLKNDQVIGYFGEIHPKTITAYELGYPIVAVEIDINGLLR